MLQMAIFGKNCISIFDREMINGAKKTEVLTRMTNVIMPTNKPTRVLMERLICVTDHHFVVSVFEVLY